MSNQPSTNMILSIEIPESRTAFIFGRQVAQLPVKLEVEHYPNPRPGTARFVFALSTLTQRTEIWATPEEAANIARFLLDNLRGRAPQHKTDI